jgi:erythronate-4-phosphate dehydrogenase
MTLRIVADENMPNVDAWFSDDAQSIIRKSGRTLTPEDLIDANVLLVRSVTQVNEALLSKSSIQFVGSATIGTDHIDQDYLADQNIAFHYAPGCNAQSVTDWLLAVLSRLHIDHDLDWWNQTIGVVGVGNVGSKVAERLERLGCNVLVCDPPKAEMGELDNHVGLDTLLEQADIVCFHTPHTQGGSCPTHQLVGSEQLAKLKLGAWLINAGRGPVFQEQALIDAVDAQQLNIVLDVWPTEPLVHKELLTRCHLASPHVAGYSLEGKFKGTEMLAQAVYHWAGHSGVKSVELPVGFKVDANLYKQNDLKKWASELVLAVYDPARDTATMLTSLHEGVIRSDTFDAMRKQYPTRRELASISLVNVPESLADWLIALGFRC